jgi:hypothetical protein
LALGCATIFRKRRQDIQQVRMYLWIPEIHELPMSVPLYQFCHDIWSVRFFGAIIRRITPDLNQAPATLQCQLPSLVVVSRVLATNEGIKSSPTISPLTPA